MLQLYQQNGVATILYVITKNHTYGMLQLYEQKGDFVTSMLQSTNLCQLHRKETIHHNSQCVQSIFPKDRQKPTP